MDSKWPFDLTGAGLLPSLVGRPCRVSILAMFMVGCSPTGSLSGQVRSPHEGKPEPVSGVRVTEDCSGSLQALAITGHEGRFENSSLGQLRPDCDLVFEGDNDNHELKRVNVGQACRARSGDVNCHELHGLDIQVEDKKPPSQTATATVTFNSEPTGLVLMLLKGDDKREDICTSPCQKALDPGFHYVGIADRNRGGLVLEQQMRFTGDTDITVRVMRHEMRRDIAGWFLVPGTVGAVVAAIAYAKHDDTLAWEGLGVAGIGLLGFGLLWSEDKVIVKTTPPMPTF
jgi:hypothetical protein